MNSSLKEIEIKFLIKDMHFLENQLKDLNATLLSGRTYELNYRFDTPDQKLSRQMQVLRLRKDRSATMTYKSDSDPTSEVSSRQEIEFEVGNFDVAKKFLEALGYHVSVIYEKYRSIYQLNDCSIMLDELPYGNFLEIEGADSTSIKKAAETLQLDWNARIKLSYLAIFYQLKEKCNLKAGNLVFGEINQSQISLEDLTSIIDNAR